MSIAIVGAGFAGLATARVLHRLGYDITVYEAMPDVGGVWSKSRSYPSLALQSTQFTYGLSELAWADGLPERPSGLQVQAYLETYIQSFGLAKHIRLSTTVVSAVQSQDRRWTVTSQSANTSGGQATQDSAVFDHLIVCNGTFSSPRVPEYPGSESFEAAGGQIVHSSHVKNLETFGGKNVVIVGYGKSACDLAVAASRIAKSVRVVARHLSWKFPASIAGINVESILAPRLGEALFLFKDPPGLLSRLLNGPLGGIRQGMISGLQFVTQSYSGLRSLDLVPEGTVLKGVGSQLHIVTPGFFEGIRAGQIVVHRNTNIRSIGAKDGQPCLTLEDNSKLPADVIIAASGWTQTVPFLSSDILKQITNADKDFVLYRWNKAPTVDGLWFNGYCSSLHSPTSFEVTALWIAAGIEGIIDLPSPAQQYHEAAEFIQHMNKLDIRHAHGTQQIPFTYGVIDTLLSDLNVKVSLTSYVAQWFFPLRPAAYKPVADEVVERILARRRAIAKGT